GHPRGEQWGLGAGRGGAQRQPGVQGVASRRCPGKATGQVTTCYPCCRLLLVGSARDLGSVDRTFTRCIRGGRGGERSGVRARRRRRWRWRVGRRGTCASPSRRRASFLLWRAGVLLSLLLPGAALLPARPVSADVLHRAAAAGLLALLSAAQCLFPARPKLFG